MLQGKDIRVGMVMTTYSTEKNRSELAISSIRSLLDHTDMSNKYLVIVDDASTDGHNFRLCQDFSMMDGVTLLFRDKNEGVGRNKRDGIEFLLTRFQNPEFLYICDDDLIYQDGWMDLALQMFVDLERSGSAVGMFGIWRHPAHKVLDGGVYPNDPRYNLIRVRDLPGCCVLMRTEVYRSAGGWNPGRREDRRGDDVATTRNVQKLGYDLFACTPPLVIHEGFVYPNGAPVCYMKEQEFENSQWISIQGGPM